MSKFIIERDLGDEQNPYRAWEVNVVDTSPPVKFLITDELLDALVKAKKSIAKKKK